MCRLAAQPLLIVSIATHSPVPNFFLDSHLVAGSAAGATACKLCSHGSYSNSSGASFALYVLIFRGRRHGSVALILKRSGEIRFRAIAGPFSNPSTGLLLCGLFQLARHGLVHTALLDVAQLECNQFGKVGMGSQLSHLSPRQHVNLLFRAVMTRSSSDNIPGEKSETRPREQE